MAISGSLEDVSVADVMQFIHLGQRTGKLMLRREGEQAMIGFHRGRLVSAGSPSTPRLGELLVASAGVDGETVEEAIRIQETEEERRSVGQILLALGAIDHDELRRVVGQQIEKTITELVGWERGTFEFVVDDDTPVDDIGLYPGDVVPDADINTQMVLLEAARIFDERNRDAADEGDATHPAAAAPEATPGPGAGPASGSWWSEADEDGGTRVVEPGPAASPRAGSAEESGVHRLQIVTGDEVLARALDHSLPPGFAQIEVVGLQAAGKAFPGHEPPIVVLDLRSEGIGLDELGRLRRTRVGTPVVALVPPDQPAGPVYEEGALAVLPPQADPIVACVAGLARNRGRSALQPERLAVVDEGRAGVERLRRVFGDLRSGLISATVALNLMHIISESVERAILFLVQRDELTALGAFGVDPEGRPLAERTRGLQISIDDDNALTRSLASGEVVTAQFERAGLPERFAELVGRPVSGRIVVFPVLGAHRVISVIYTDNGENESPIEDIDILELATAQVGMAFENELLRRQISQQS